MYAYMIKDVVFEETHDNAMNVETEPRVVLTEKCSAG